MSTYLPGIFRTRTRANQHTNNPKPTKQEWEKMEVVKRFKLSGAAFYVGDDAIVNSPDEEANVWVAKIKDIRRRDSDHGKQFWVYILWYFSPKDISTLIPLFDATVLGANERLLSDRSDILSAKAFNAVIRVRNWSDSDIDLPEISEQTYFQRFKVSWLNARFVSDIDVTLPGENACLHQCDQIYNPFPDHDDRQGPRKRSELVANSMHFCPRRSCRKWFHRACLLREGYYEHEGSFIPGSRALRLFAADPDSEIVWKKLQRFVMHTPSNELSNTDLRSYVLSGILEGIIKEVIELPEELIEVAGFPIVRYPGAGVLSTAGNMKDVVLARRLVYQVLQCDQKDYEKSLRSLEHDYGHEWATDSQAYSAAWDLLSSDSSRILACPRDKYWGEIRSSDIMRLAESEPYAFLCPSCENAI